MTTRPDRFSVFALAYLALPALVFCAGWLEPAPGIVVAAILAAALLPLRNVSIPTEDSGKDCSATLWLLVLALLWAALGGAGHFVYANPDWQTRDAVYSDLIFSAWPPAYRNDAGEQFVLRSATGFFLVPAALAKLTGIDTARWLLYLWSALGTLLFLSLLPLPPRFGLRLVLLSLAVVGFSGMDYPAILAVHGHAPLFPLPLEWWRPWTYTSLTGQLFWAPNHALSLWIGSALILRHRNSDSLAPLMVVMLPLILLWTPFAVGLLPWAAWAFWQRRQLMTSMLRSVKAVQWAAALSFTILLIAYLSRPGVSSDLLAIGPGVEANGIAMTWSFHDRMTAYVQFAAFEFGILALLLRPSNSADRSMLGLAVALLLLLPMARIGPSNDWMLRVSTPCLIALLVLMLNELPGSMSELRKSWRAIGLTVVVATGAITPGFEIARALLWKRTPPNYGQSLIEAQKGYFAPHYLGKMDLPLLQAMFKAPTPAPPGRDRTPTAR